MFWKDQFAREVLAMPDCSYQSLIDLRAKFPSLRVKTLDAKGKVPVIRFDDSSEWLKPKEWADNHRTAICCKYQEQHSRVKDLGCDPSHLVNLKSHGDSTNQNANGDNVDILSLQRKQKLSERNYLMAMDMLRKVAMEKMTSIDVKIKIADYDPDHPTYIF